MSLKGSVMLGSEHGAMDVAGPPAAYGGAAVEEDFHKADHAGVVDFNAGIANE